MAEIVKIYGQPTRQQRKIRDMEIGEIGYTVEWAVRDGKLDDNFTVGIKGGTLSLQVTCVAPSEYMLVYEKPIYRDPF